MKHSLLTIATGLLAIGSQASAQSSLRLPDPLDNLRPAEKVKLREQAVHFFLAAKPAVATAAKSTVSIDYRRQRIAYGTVVSRAGTTEPVILTKWSEVAKVRNQIVVTTPEGKQYPAQVSGIYPDHDLALLTIEERGAALTPLDLSASAIPEPGHFVTLARPDGNVEGFGVVSVAARSLREDDKAYLGVLMDFTATGNKGVPLKRVMPDSAAARAGLRDGDVIIAIDQENITGAMEMRNMLQRLAPGSDVTVRYRRGHFEKDATVNLGSRADNTDIRRVPRERMEQMERMGTVPSRIRSNFPNVIQTDMPIQGDPTPRDPRDNFSNDCGGPVTNLDGNIVGIAIARGSRIKTFIIPTSTVQEVLASSPQPVSRRLTRQDIRRALPSHQRHASHSSPADTDVPPPAIPAEENEIGEVRRLLEEIEHHNDVNSRKLRRIKEALRKFNGQDGDQR